MLQVSNHFSYMLIISHQAAWADLQFAGVLYTYICVYISHAHFAIITASDPSTFHPHPPALPRPTPTSISYLPFHPALFVDKPRGHWPAHMVPMWHFSNSLMARLEAPAVCVCLCVCVIGGLSEERSNYCSFFVLSNHDPPHPPKKPPPLPASLPPGWHFLFIAIAKTPKPNQQLVCGAYCHRS